MIERPKLRVVFYLNGKRYASRNWWAVPRKGDLVNLGPDHGKEFYLCGNATFGQESDEEAKVGWQTVAVPIRKDRK